VSNRYEECNSCANQETDPAICDRCHDADQFESIDGDTSVQTVTLDDLRKIVFRKATY
jgi:hypothetical protein